MKRFGLLVCVLIVCGVLSPGLCAASQDITLLIVPREDVPVRVAMDVGTRYPTLVLSYKVMPGGAVSLHGWSGSEWVSVTQESFDSGTFFQSSPGSAMVVEEGAGGAPESLIPSPDWCPEVYRITTTETRPLLHLIGRHYDFKYKDWKWFSAHYKLPLNSINPDGLNVAWYHQRLGENLKKDATIGSSDLQYFFVVRSPQLTAEAEMELPPEESVEGAASNQVETAESMADNPLTNAAPPAVILGAGDADEAKLAEPRSEGDEAESARDESTPMEQE